MTETTVEPLRVYRTERIRAWCDVLWEGTYEQGKGHLAASTVTFHEDADPTVTVGYCCLGVGCLVAGVRHEVETNPSERLVEEGDPLGNFGDGYTDLAPPEFMDWLGLPVGNSIGRETNGSDVYIDIPVGMPKQGLEDAGSAFQQTQGQITAAGLNDSGFTFPQIADLIWYFGLVEHWEE